MNGTRSRLLIASLLVALLTSTILLQGCGSLSNTERGAATGAGAGAVVGGVIGNATGSTSKGAIIGAVVGGAAGAVIGQQMDQQAEELDEELEGAEVSRVGEGIEVTFDNALLFDFDSATLQRPAQNNLQSLLSSLQEYPQTEVLIVGHTDATGDDSYNQDLSERRAEAAATYLMRQGLSPDRITTVGRGEDEPIASNDTAEGRQENRRVEVAIFASEEYREEVQRRQGG